MAIRIPRSFYIGLCSVAICAGVQGQAMAQITDAQRGLVDPSRVSESLRLDSSSVGAQADIDVSGGEVSTAPAGADKMFLTLSNLAIDGVTVYQGADIAHLYQDKLGQKVSLADVYDIAAKLTRKYRNDGYILTRVVVPPQRIGKSGDVKLQVVEGFVGKITVSGDEESALEMVRAYAAQMKLEGPLNTKQMERALLLINDLPGVQARSVLSPSESEVGAADLTIIVERDPYDAFVSLDNYGSRYLGPLQFSAAGNANSVFGQNEKISAQVVYAPGEGFESELNYIYLAYEQPIFDNGTKIQLAASYADTDPGYDLDQFRVQGFSRNVSMTVSHPVVRSRTYNVSTYAKLDLKDVDSKNILEATRKDRLSVLRGGADVQFVDRLWNVGVNTFNFVLSQGTGLLGASEKSDANKSRAQGDPRFTSLSVEAQRLQRISDKINFLVAFKGQLSNNSLLSSEEFGVGGSAYGRGYDSSEIVGDEGYAGKMEVQWNTPKEISWLEDYQLYGFYDFGRVWNGDATTADLERESLASVGVGARLTVTEDLDAGVMVAKPLTRDVQTMGDEDIRGFFNIMYKF